MSEPVLESVPLGFPWVTVDPFLFCVHHDDAYPRGNASLGPAASLDGRTLGQDFTVKDGFRMYHGTTVPGFPQHPHRGFETVTIVRRGIIDHSDSLGATARFGAGDVQWLTAGKGIVHSEMFPLLDPENPNPLELFQIWLNLPAEDKMVPPYFTMLWNARVPRVGSVDARGRRSEIAVIAGALEEAKPPSPPPSSWGARPESDLAIWSVRLDAGAERTLPRARGAETVRTIYFFRGSSLHLGEHLQTSHAALVVRADVPLRLVAGDDPCEVLVLQGRPIGQPVVSHGPFVMNTREEIQRAFADYQATRFGGWPFADDAPVHPREAGRFAKHADGRVEDGRER
jgi:redox-sensitive bicupin YhaK (pirin superfamily)